MSFLSSSLGSDFFGGPSYTRGVFIGDGIYAVTDRVVVQADLDDVANSQTRLELPSPFDPGDVVILEGDAGASSEEDVSDSQEE